jgi:hypothetical protein
VRSPETLANAVIEVLGDLDTHRGLAATGQSLVQHMFDVKRTGHEIAEIYRHILHGSSRPANFDSREYLTSLKSRVPLMEGAAV